MRFLLMAVATVALVCLGGCNADPGGQNTTQAQADTLTPADPATPPDIHNVATIFVDPDTGCQYWDLAGHGITPVLNQHGEPVCSDNRL